MSTYYTNGVCLLFDTLVDFFRHTRYLSMDYSILKFPTHLVRRLHRPLPTSPFFFFFTIKHEILKRRNSYLKYFYLKMESCQNLNIFFNTSITSQGRGSQEITIVHTNDDDLVTTM